MSKSSTASGTSAAKNDALVPTTTSAPQPPPSDASSEHVTIRVIDQSGNEVHFKIKKTTPFSKLMDAFCVRQGVERSRVRFLYDGERVDDKHTPLFHKMEDGDVVDAVVQQLV